MTEPRAAFQDGDTQTGVQPNDNDTDPASEDAQASAEASLTSGEANPADEAPPPEIFTAEEADELPPCAVCRQTIGPGADYVTAAYGPVHAEPCSHQSATPRLV